MPVNEVVPAVEARLGHAGMVQTGGVDSNPAKDRRSGGKTGLDTWIVTGGIAPARNRRHSNGRHYVL